MATTETWALDGVSLTSGNFDVLELNVDPPKARAEIITAADSEYGALMRQPLHEDRIITMTLRVAQQASMNAALDQIGTIRDKLRLASSTADGIALTWTPANSTRTVTFDVLNGDFTGVPVGLDDHAWSWFRQRPIFTVEMRCKPYWRGTETTTSTASSSTPFVTLEVTGVTGDVPALGRLIVTDTATQNRRHAEWGLESQYYNSGTSLLVDSDNMTVGAGYVGTATTRTGAYDPNATGNNVIRATLYNAISAVCSTGSLSHVGTFRVKARVWSTSVDVHVRLAWQDGDGPFATNEFTTAPVINGFSEVDLGLITITPAASGTQRWTGKIEAYSFSNAGAETLDVDYLILVPAGEGYGRARSAYAWRPGQTVGVDDFQSLGAASALNARVAPLGGTWATSGATTDFAGSTTFTPNVTASRSTNADTGNGRFAILGSTSYTDLEVRTEFFADKGSATITSGVLFLGTVARYVDSSNYLMGYVQWTATPRMKVVAVVAGTPTVLADFPIGALSPTWWTVRLIVWASGVGQIRLEGPLGDLRNAINFNHSSLATAGALASGKPGIMDSANGTPVTVNRYHDDFWVSVPPPEAIVTYSSRVIEFRHNDTLRQDSAGTVYGRPASYRGTRFLVPPGTSRVLAKARRNDIEAGADDAVTDATQIQVAWTPRGLVVPR